MNSPIIVEIGLSSPPAGEYQSPFPWNVQPSRRYSCNFILSRWPEAPTASKNFRAISVYA